LRVKGVFVSRLHRGVIHVETPFGGSAHLACSSPISVRGSLSFAAVLINWTSREVSMLQLTEKIPDIETPDIVVLQTPPPPPLPPAPTPKDQMIIETKADVEPVEFIDSEDDRVIEENLVEGADEDYRDEEIFRPSLPPIDKGSDSDSDEIILKPERMPRFPGCEGMGLTADELQMCSDRRLLEFVAKNIQFTSIARENRIAGVAVISFMVNRNGKIEDPKIVRDPGGGLGEQALRVVKMMNEMDESWIPVEQAGRKVNVRFNLPVRFVLE
jgi:protein TonB